MFRGADDVMRLQACVRDLVALSNMRPCWVGRTPAVIAENVRDLLVGMLRADTVYIELKDPETRETHVVSHPGSAPAQIDDYAPIRFASYPVGGNGDLGRFAIGSSRVNFPDPLEIMLIGVAANEVAVALRHAGLLIRHERAERLLAARAMQQAVVAALGIRAVTGTGIEAILSDVVTTIRDTLHVDFCEIFERATNGETLTMRAADGWSRPVRDTVRMPSGPECPTGLALHDPEPVVVQDLRSDARFAPHSLLHEHGVVSSISVIVHGRDGPFGVLGAHSREPRAFTRDDVHFQQSMANVLAGALERDRVNRERDGLLAAAAKAQAEAEAASRVKSEFLGMMSHELRTPLNAIGGYAALLEEGIRGPISEDQKRDLARIRRSQRYLLGVIDNVLSFLKLGSGRVRYDIDEVAIEAILTSVEEVIRPLIEGKGLRYQRQSTADDERVSADREKLQQILLNLLSNAVKFTDSGGLVELDAAVDGSTVRIDVRDTGCGIPRDRLQSVFEPFTQIDSTRTRAVQGTGLGLTISREFARGMGGELIVDSEMGKGSVFSVALPRSA
jgi:signal transduction histidine kinase